MARSPIPKNESRKKKDLKTHGEHHDHVLFLFHHYGQIVADLEPAERLVDEQVADLRRGDEPCCCGQEVARAQSAGLQAERAEG